MSDSLISPFEVTKTILGIRNELIGITALQHNPLLDTTLNYKYGNNADVVPSEKPKVAYFGIGINGAYNVDDGNLSTPYIPSMQNMDLYAPIPFRCVPLDEDLTPAERSNYRMRIRQTINEQDFWCYYLKKITFVDTDVQITRTDPTTQEEEAFELDTNNLNPTPQVPSATGVQAAEGTEVNVTTNCKLQILGSEVLEAVSAMYGDPRRANVSEIGVYTGLDQTVTGQDSEGNDIDYLEAVYAQMAIHYCSIGFPFLSAGAVKDMSLRLGKSNVMLL